LRDSSRKPISFVGNRYGLVTTPVLAFWK